MFENVYKQSFKIKNIVTGIAEFIPINFKKDYFSVLNIQIQSAMLDYKFRVDLIDKRAFKNVGEFFFGSETGQLPKMLEFD